MSSMRHFLSEYAALRRVLGPHDLLALAVATAANAPAILRTGKLTRVDAAMSRDMTVHFSGVPITLPLAQIDRLLAATGDNPSFGNVREIYARNCYLRHLALKRPVRAVLDLGANRGMVSLLALRVLEAQIVVGVEPEALYLPIHRLLLEANGCSPNSSPRYTKFVSSPSAELRAPGRSISIATILREQQIDRFHLVKIDIEGHEGELFSEPEWLAKVDNITMELHPTWLKDVSLIPRVMADYGFEYLVSNQAGYPAPIESGMFLVASCTGELAG
jgi:hypothetical protein